ncbi:hypothetical protein CDAR_87941 [Caerostris darwini]|uniref:Uncharacterized protein n=1 Tax=Caerostris darwini TaxID=1538125 RepID=A0AAV4S2Z8_9ARAC|nr:hypothetical protein CDAR_87941 [Caerostris darwini]
MQNSVNLSNDSAFNLQGRPEPKPRVLFRTVEDLHVYLAAEKVRYTRAKRANKALNKVRARFGLRKVRFEYLF